MKTRFLTLALTLLSAVGAWAYDFKVDGIYYNIIFGYEVSVIRVSSSSRAITIPSSVLYNGQRYSVTSIGDEAFCYGSALTSVTIPNSVTSIGDEAFEECSALTNVYYTGSVANWCQIEFFTLSSNPLSNGANFYINNQLVTTDLVIPNEVNEIKNYTFSGCKSLESVTIGNSVKSIGSNAFSDCEALESVTLGYNVKSIGNYAFYRCYALTSVTIPNSVTSIGEDAFDDCRSIISYATIPPKIESSTFSSELRQVAIPTGTLNVYRKSEYWKDLNYHVLASSNQLIVKQNEGGSLKYNNNIITSGSILEISTGSNILLQIIPDEGFGISSITCGDTDYTDKVNSNGYLTLPTILSTTTLQVNFELVEAYTISYYTEGSSIIFNNKVNKGEDFTFYVTTENDYNITSITLNGTDITRQLNANGSIYLNNIQEDIVIVVSTTATSFAPSPTNSPHLRAWQANSILFVEMDNAVEAVMVYDVTGRLMQTYQHRGGYQILNLPALNTVNLVKVVCKDGNVSTHKLM